MTTQQSIIHPLHFQIIRREGTTWYFKSGSIFYNKDNQPIPEHDRERLFGLTKNQIVTQLFRLQGGKAGYYLADLKAKKYYYCGDWDSVKDLLRSLGIGRDEPSK